MNIPKHHVLTVCWLEQKSSQCKFLGKQPHDEFICLKQTPLGPSVALAMEVLAKADPDCPKGDRCCGYVSRETTLSIAVEKEKLLGTWEIVGGLYKAKWIFHENGDVDSTTSGPATGRWTIDLVKKHVLINWKSNLVDKLNIPLDPKLTIGQQVDGEQVKYEAKKYESAVPVDRFPD